MRSNFKGVALIAYHLDFRTSLRSSSNRQAKVSFVKGCLNFDNDNNVHTTGKIRMGRQTQTNPPRVFFKTTWVQILLSFKLENAL